MLSCVLRFFLRFPAFVAMLRKTGVIIEVKIDKFFKIERTPKRINNKEKITNKKEGPSKV